MKPGFMSAKWGPRLVREGFDALDNISSELSEEDKVAIAEALDDYVGIKWEETPGGRGESGAASPEEMIWFKRIDAIIKKLRPDYSTPVYPNVDTGV